MTKFCSQCGRGIDADAKFCAGCGASIAPDVHETTTEADGAASKNHQPPTTEPTNPVNDDPPEQRRQRAPWSTRKKVVVGIATVVLVAAVAGVALGTSRKSNSSSPFPAATAADKCYGQSVGPLLTLFQNPLDQQAATDALDQYIALYGSNSIQFKAFEEAYSAGISKAVTGGYDAGMTAALPILTSVCSQLSPASASGATTTVASGTTGPTGATDTVSTTTASNNATTSTTTSSGPSGHSEVALACAAAPTSASLVAAIKALIPTIYGQVGPTVTSGNITKASKCWGKGWIGPADTSGSAPANEQFQGSEVFMHFVNGRWLLVTYGTGFAPYCAPGGDPTSSKYYVPKAIMCSY